MKNYNEKINAAIAHLCILSDEVFQPYFANILCAQELIRVLMKDKTIELVKVEAQKHLINTLRKQVIPDGYAIDKNGVIYVVEVQKNNNDDIQKRLRYSLGLITSKLTEKGTKYKDIKAVVGIAICNYDPFKKKLSYYEIVRTIKETHKTVYNGVKEVYIDCSHCGNDEIGALMKLLTSEEYVEDARFEETDKFMKEFLLTDGGKNSMSDAIKEIFDEAILESKEEGRKEGKEEGRKEGEAKGRKEGEEKGRKEGEEKGRNEGMLEGRKEGEANGKKKTIVSLFKDGTISKKKAMSLLNVTLQEFSELLTIY